MDICKAVIKRINELLVKNDITLYRLEQNSGILHGTMMSIMKNRNKNITLKTLYQLARGFNMTIIEFLNNEVFLNEELEID